MVSETLVTKWPQAKPGLILHCWYGVFSHKVCVCVCCVCSLCVHGVYVYVSGMYVCACIRACGMECVCVFCM